MPQFGRPSADTSIGSWEDEGGGTTTIFQSIDEVSANDTDFVRSELAPSNSPYVTKLSNMEDPLLSTGHIVRYRFEKDAAAGSQIDLLVELREAYVNEGTPGIVRASKTETNIDDSWNAGTFTLSAGEADSITDYTDLFLRFRANQV